MTRSLSTVVRIVALVPLLLPACGSSTGKASASASRVSSQDQLIGGPKALGEIGDYIIENDKVRFIIQGPGPGRGSMLYPGSIIDADLRRPGNRKGGLDQLGEITPAFLFESFNPTSFEVTADGSAGGSAVVTVRGEGDDLFQRMAVINTGLLFPENLTFQIDYILEPGSQYLEVVTTVENSSTVNHGFPFLDPPELRDLGLDIPGLDQLQLSVPFGQFVLLGAENKLFATGSTGFNVRFAIEDSYASSGGLPAFPGIVTDFLASSGGEVSYGVTTEASPTNYPSTFRDAYEPAQQVTESSTLVPFIFASVIGAFHANPPANLAPGESFSYKSYVVVGRGDVSSVSDVIYDLRGTVTGGFGGRMVDSRTGEPVAGASIVVKNGSDHYISQLTTDDAGAFRGELPPGDYSYQVVSHGRHTTSPVPFSVRAGQVTSAIIELLPPAVVSVSVRDGDGRALPSKVSLVATLPGAIGDPRQTVYDLAVGERRLPTSFEAGREQYIEDAWYSADGRSRREVRPGTYEMVVSRGLEYDVHRETVVLAAGKLIERSITLVHSVDTTGYIGGDLHLHSRNSVDSGLSLDDRVISIAGEGIEYAAATDHNYITDYAPAIARHELTSWLLSSVGVEVTTFEMGHFNAYPIDHDSASARGGRFVWGGETPDSIFDQMRALGPADGALRTILQINHPRWDSLGYFNVFQLDQETLEPGVAEGLEAVFSPFGPEFGVENFSTTFDAVEILNGKRVDLLHTYRVPEVLPPPPLPDPIPPAGEVVRSSSGRVSFPGAMEDWFAFLNAGVRFTGVGASDSHRTLGDEPGYPRSYIYVGEDSDGIGQATVPQVLRGIREGRVVVSMGPMIHLTVNGDIVGSTLTDTDGQVDVTIRISSPNFAPVEKVVLWANGRRLLEYDVPAAQALDFTVTESVSVGQDTWFLVEATGSQNMFPVVSPKEYESLSPAAIVDALASSLDLSALEPSGNLKPVETFFLAPLAFTNPIFVDVDGNGVFDPNGAPGVEPPTAIAARAGQAAARGTADLDVRDVFERIEGDL